MRFMIYHDDDIFIYINGVWAATKKGSVSNYIPYDISDEARQTLKPNSWNLIAVKCIQTGYDQIVDVGISRFQPQISIIKRCMTNSRTKTLPSFRNQAIQQNRYLKK